jgi:hypothetical protein
MASRARYPCSNVRLMSELDMVRNPVYPYPVHRFVVLPRRQQLLDLRQLLACYYVAEHTLLKGRHPGKG